MIYPDKFIKKQFTNREKPSKNIPELLATILAFVSTFIFFFKILFF